MDISRRLFKFQGKYYFAKLRDKDLGNKSTFPFKIIILSYEIHDIQLFLLASSREVETNSQLLILAYELYVH
jgi:hypothetical protein